MRPAGTRGPGPSRPGRRRVAKAVRGILARMRSELLTGSSRRSIGRPRWRLRGRRARLRPGLVTGWSRRSFRRSGRWRAERPVDAGSRGGPGGVRRPATIRRLLAGRLRRAARPLVSGSLARRIRGGRGSGSSRVRGRRLPLEPDPTGRTAEPVPRCRRRRPRFPVGRRRRLIAWRRRPPVGHGRAIVEGRGAEVGGGLASSRRRRDLGGRALTGRRWLRPGGGLAVGGR
jgi:hypothetical protein